jgi:hypothetical protein
VSEVGLVITAEDKAGAVLKTIGDTGKAALGGVRGAAEKAGRAFSMFGDAATKINQAMELGKKALEFFRRAVVDTVAVALEFRKAGDPIVAEFERIKNQAQVLRARIGDVMIPILLGLSDAFRDTGNSVIDYINTNRQLIATNIAQFLAETARILVQGVAVGANLAAKAWFGILEVVDLVKIAVNAQFELILSGLAQVVDGLNLLTGFLPGVGDGFKNVAATVRGLRDEFTTSREAASDSLIKNAQTLTELEGKIEEYKTVAVDRVGQAELAMLERIKNARQGMNQVVDAQIEKQKEHGDAIDRFIQKRAEARDKQLELDEQMIRKREEQIEATNQMAVSANEQLITGAMDVLSDFDETVENKLKAFAKIAIQTGAQVVSKLIAQHAAAAAAGAASSQAGVPVVGPALAVTAAAAMLAFVTKFATKFQFGGVVPGVGNSDTVAAMLTPGERVLNQRERRDYERGERAAPAQNLNLSINAQIQNPEEMTDDQIKRWLVRIDSQASELIRDNMLFTGLQRTT